MEKYLPKIKGIPVIDTLPLEGSAESVFEYFSSRPNSFLLNSALGSDSGRYAFLGLHPFLSLKHKSGNTELHFGKHNLLSSGDPFDLLDSIINTYKIENPTPLPFVGGGMGYFSYDLKDTLEKLPGKASDDLLLPDMYFVFYKVLLIYDKLRPGNIYFSILNVEDGSDLKASDIFREIRSAAGAPSSSGSATIDSTDLISNFTKSEYLSAVNKVIDYIRAGDIYQACLTQRFKTTCSAAPYDLYKRLTKINPSPFSAYLNCGDHQIISSSPELFLKVANNIVETRPMKGTRPRVDSEEKNKELREDLLKSEKDAAELSMIVDLERNDLGKVCKAGTVKVTEHRRIEEYPTVFQTISIVKGLLEKDTGLVDVIKAAFPGGSITGCPKVRAMEIIDELEPTQRHVYTGSIGYLSFHDTMELNVAIRTLLMKGNNVYFQAGGGVIADSDPESEYEETLHKAKAMMDALGSRQHCM